MPAVDDFRSFSRISIFILLVVLTLEDETSDKFSVLERIHDVKLF